MPVAQQAALRAFVMAIADGAPCAGAFEVATAVWQAKHPENSEGDAREAVRRLVSERLAEVLAETIRIGSKPIEVRSINPQSFPHPPKL